MPKIKFSIIIPTYNRAYCLWKAIQSILNQTYPYFEIIVIDDASTDDTKKLIKQFTDPRIKYFINKKNLGPSASRNVGINKAKNPYIAYLDSDNTWYNDFLEVYTNAIQNNKSKKVFYSKKNYRLNVIEESNKSISIRDENTNTNNFFDLKRLFHRKILIDTNVLVHEKSIIKKIGGWDENLSFWEDWEITLRIADRFGDVFHPINRVLLDYEQTIDFSNRDKVKKEWENAEKYIFEKYNKNLNIEGQKWYPPEEGDRSTLSIIEYLKKKKN